MAEVDNYRTVANTLAEQLGVQKQNIANGEAAIEQLEAQIQLIVRDNNARRDKAVRMSKQLTGLTMLIRQLEDDDIAEERAAYDNATTFR